MKTRKNMLMITIASVLCLVSVVAYQTNAEQQSKTYEIHPDIALDMTSQGETHVLSAYERLMDRYMGMVENDLAKNSRSLTSIEKKLDNISARLTRIEKHLDIIPSGKKIKKSGKL